MVTLSRLIRRWLTASPKGGRAAKAKAAAAVAGKRARRYPAELVGEQHYAGAGQCRVGDRVWLRCEPSNAHDDMAVQAITAAATVIGYLPRDNWLRRAIHDEGKGALCHVLHVEKGKGMTQVVLDVEVRPRKDAAHRVLDEGEAP